MFRATVLMAICTYLVSAAFGQSLSDSKTEYEDSIAAARKDMLLAMQDRVDLKIKEGKNQALGQLAEWKSLFETRGVLAFGEEAMFSHYRKYGASIKSAEEKLQEAYAAEIKQLTANMQTDEAQVLVDELANLHLRGDLISLQTYRPKYYFKHFGLEGFGGEIGFPADRLNATFELTSGLSDSVHTSIRLLNWPDSYIDHSGFRIHASAARDDFSWKQHASWMQLPGLADKKNGVSFRSVSHPDRFIRIRSDGQAWLDVSNNSPAFFRDATFYIKKPLFKMW
jgi:hypothetical protein